MKLDEVLATARDTVTVRRVFAEPYDQNGVTVIAAAAVSGGGGLVTRARTRRSARR